MGRVWMSGSGGEIVDIECVTAVAADVITGKVIVDKTGARINGNMINRGAITTSINAGGSYTIPAGYHNGSGKVTANSLSSQTSATAVANQILKGQTAWVNGTKITGTMNNYAGRPQHIDARRLNNNRFEVAVANGFHGYSWAQNSYEYMELSEVASTLGLTAAKLAKGQTVCGVAGTYTSDGNAAAGDIRKNKTAYVNGSKITGNMSEKAAATITPSTSNQTISANQYLTGAQTIKGDSNLVAANIIKGKSIFGVSGSAKAYKSISKVITSSSSRKSFVTSVSGETISLYAVEFSGSLGLEPMSCVCHADNITNSINATFFLYSSKTYWYMVNCNPAVFNFIRIVSPSFCTSSGFCIPVHRASTSYTVFITGYAV